MSTLLNSRQLNFTAWLRFCHTSAALAPAILHGFCCQTRCSACSMLQWMQPACSHLTSVRVNNTWGALRAFLEGFQDVLQVVHMVQQQVSEGLQVCNPPLVPCVGKVAPVGVDACE